MSESVLSFLEEKNLPEVIKKKHTYLMMDVHDQEDIYVCEYPSDNPRHFPSL